MSNSKNTLSTQAKGKKKKKKENILEQAIITDSGAIVSMESYKSASI